MTTYDEDRVPHDVDGDGSIPTLSVTVLNYNYARYLPQCLDSILKQTWKDFELIIINDCSTDNSLEVIEPYLGDPRVRLVNHTKNQGYIKSLIEGSESSRGKYITVISADDFCVSDRAFETLLQVMEADPEVAFAYSSYGICGDDGIRTWFNRPVERSCVRSGAEEYRDLVLNGNHMLHSGVIIRAKAYKAVGGYDPTARYSCDTIMWLMLCGYGSVAYCADELFAYRKHGSNMSLSRSGIPEGLHEDIYGVKKTFPAMRGSPGISEGLRVQALKCGLIGPAMAHAFAGNLSLAWYAYWCAFRIHPMLTVFQGRTLILLARTLLGHRGYHRLQSLLKRSQPVLAPELRV